MPIKRVKGEKTARERPDLVKVERKIVAVVKKRKYLTGMSFTTLCNKANMNRATLVRVLAGESHLTLIEYLAICMATDTDPIEILNNVIAPLYQEISK